MSPQLWPPRPKPVTGGTATVPSAVWLPIVFPIGMFNIAPVVTATVVGSGRAATYRDVTASGFDLGAAGTGSALVSWVAQQV